MKIYKFAIALKGCNDGIVHLQLTVGFRILVATFCADSIATLRRDLGGNDFLFCLVERTDITTTATTAANITRSSATKINSIADSVICVGIFTLLAILWYLL